MWSYDDTNDDIIKDTYVDIINDTYDDVINDTYDDIVNYDNNTKYYDNINDVNKVNIINSSNMCLIFHLKSFYFLRVRVHIDSQFNQLFPNDR